MKFRKPYKGWRRLKQIDKLRLRHVVKPGDTLLFGTGMNTLQGRLMTPFILAPIRFFSKTIFHHCIKCESPTTYFSVEAPKATRISDATLRKQGLVVVLRPKSYITPAMIKKMIRYWNRYMDDVSYDERQLFVIMFNKLLGYGYNETRKFSGFEEGKSEVVCSVGVAILDRLCLGFDPVPGVDKDLIDPGMLERSPMYDVVAWAHGDKIIREL